MMRPPRALVAVLFVLCLAPGASRAGEARQASRERAPGVFDREVFVAEQKAAHGELSRGEVAAGREHPVTVAVTDEERGRIDRPQGERRVRVGVVKKVGLDVRPGAPDFGSSRGRRWTGTIRSDGASALRVHFTAFSLPEDSALFLYNDEGVVRGPYTGAGPQGDGEFWSHTIPGDEVVLQLQGDGRFTVQDLGHLGSKFGPGGSEQSHTGDLCPFNASCVESASCNAVPAAIEPATDAVAHILFRSGAFFYICSGGLLADTDPSSQTPWFLTANHCLNKGRDAKTVEAFFQFQAPCGVCSDSSSAPSTLGSQLAATNRTGDYTLLRLDEPPPPNSVFLGWTSAAVAFSNQTDLFRIHHPKGAPQSYSEHSVHTTRPTCQSWPRGPWIYSVDTFGATEGGSSGSPVLDAAGRVVGQLSGGCGYNVGDTCDSSSNATVDGAFASYFAEVASFLDPDTGGGCTQTQDPETSCSDGVDNDCDGAVDGADSDCAGGPGACVPTHPNEKGQRCSDGVDNDCDGAVDGADRDCSK